MGAVRGDVDDLPAQPLHQRGVFAHRVYHDDPVIGGEEHIDQLPLGGKALAGAVEPRYIPLADFSFLRSAMMTLWERAFMP